MNTFSELLKKNSQFFFVLLLWAAAGILFPPAVYALIPVTIYLFWRREFIPELLIGFWFILILSDNLDGPLGFAKGFKNVYIVLLTVLFFFNRKYFTPVNHLFQPFLAFFAISFISLFNTETFAVSFQKNLSYIFLFTAIPSYVQKNFSIAGEEFYKKIIFFVTSFLVISLAFIFISPDLAISHGGRFRGLFGNPNGMGIFCVLFFLFFYVINDFFPDLFSRAQKILVYLVILTCIFKSGSRNATASILLFLMFSRVYRISAFLGFVVFLSALTGYILIGLNFAEIVRTLGLESYFRLETLEEGGGRFVAWQFAWDQIQNNFFLGKGFAFDEYIMRKNFDHLSRLGHEGGVHNTYLIIWLNTGIIGLLAFLTALFYTFTKAAKNTPLAFPILYTVMFTIMFEPWLAASLNPFTILFLIIATVITSPQLLGIKEDANEAVPALEKAA